MLFGRKKSNSEYSTFRAEDLREMAKKCPSRNSFLPKTESL